MPSNGIVATYSIVAFDPETDSLGVAVQSKFLAVGSVVPWARAGVGAVATQAMANYNYGPQGLDLMSEGHTADETIEALLSADEDREHRQVGIVDGKGRAATFTGSECFDWAGGVTGDHFAGPGKHPCRRGDGLGHGERLQRGGGGPHRAAALGARCRAEGWRGLARQTVGGVARRAGGRGLRRDNDRVVDLRVDDHPEPIEELIRIRELHTLYFGETKPEDVIAVDGEVRAEVAEALHRAGYLSAPYVADDLLFDALSAYIRTENFEEREQRRGHLDRAILEYMKVQG